VEIICNSPIVILPKLFFPRLWISRRKSHYKARGLCRGRFEAVQEMHIYDLLMILCNIMKCCSRYGQPVWSLSSSGQSCASESSRRFWKNAGASDWHSAARGTRIYNVASDLLRYSPRAGGHVDQSRAPGSSYGRVRGTSTVGTAHFVLHGIWYDNLHHGSMCGCA
jgi:hypothetical protein